MSVGILIGAGLAALTLITFVHPGSTRMFAWPWSVAYAIALIAPTLALIRRAFAADRPLVLPPRPCLLLGIGTAVVLLASAWASPYRAQSLLWSAPWLAGVAVFFLAADWLHGSPDANARRREQLRTALLVGFAALALLSLLHWTRIAADFGWAVALARRNDYPLGHSNYIAGLALLALPIAWTESLRRTGRRRLFAAATVALGVILIATTGSRAGFAVLGLLALAAALPAPWSHGTKLVLLGLTLLGCAAAVVLHPRIRATLLPGADRELISSSATQRSAMAAIGLRMGAERPLLGWGPGTTPLAYPRFRYKVDGGVENALQLHSAPVHIGAELGLAGLACLAAALVLLVRHRRNDPAAAASLGAYAVFALTDWQLDIPIFSAIVAVLAAALVRSPYPSLSAQSARTSLAPTRAVGALALACLASIAVFGRPDPAAPLNARALHLADDPQNVDRAIALLRESLALNPHQEIAHTNLGWLLVVSDPPAAERHFRAAARLVPDKGGIYFGLGLALLNQDNDAAAARAFALEALNDPAFLTSPYWREPAIAATRADATVALQEFLRRAASELPTDSTTAARLARVAAAADQLGRVPDAPERTLRRQRTGYPVLMRNLDLAPPLDVFVVRESAPAAPDLPPKGWLPSRLLLALLDTFVPATP